MPPFPTADIFTRALIATASNFVGLAETKQNTAWDDPKTAASEAEKSALLSAEMRHTGWTPPEPYCAAFAGAMVALSFKNLGWPEAAANFLRDWTPHCMTNVRRLRTLKALQPNNAPADGALMLMRHGNTDSGHAAIVASVNGKFPNRMLATIEGNTDSGGSREGDGIYSKARNVTSNGNLTTQGFLWPKDILMIAAIGLARVA